MSRRKNSFIHAGMMLSFFLFVFFQVNGQNKTRQGSSTVHIQLKAIAGLRYDVVRFQVKPGASVQLTFINADDMDHNIVFTRPGCRLKVMNAALKLGEKGPAADYIPVSPDLLWKIPKISSGDTQTIRFVAPKTKGIYPYLCTYPGHGNTMYGVMYVTDKPLQPLNTDPNVPPAREGEMTDGMHDAAHMQQHPYPIVAPYLMRTFMPDCGPAAIAVYLPNNLSYCWDAGNCRLRYSWSGGFLKSADLWKRKGDEAAKIAGAVFFTDETDYPFRIGADNSIPKVKFKGYRFVNHYPEFHFLMNGMDVYELIESKPDGSGLTCSFRIIGATKAIRYIKKYSGSVVINASEGKWKGNSLELSPDQASRFTITITKKEDSIQ